jgi:multiple sugar transport system substrate-binding protein
VTLSFWKGPHRADEATAVAEPTFAKFTEANPNIHVDFLAVAWGDYTTKFGAAFAGGTPPDVSYQTESFPTYVNGNDILALDTLMQTNKFDRTFFYPQLWDVCTYSGKTYAVPWVNGGSCLFWNKTLFEQVGLDPKTPPNTMDDFVAAAQKLTRAGTTPTYGFSTGATDTHENGQWPRRWGGHWFDAQRTKCTVDSSPAIAGFQFLYDLFYKSQVAMPFALQGKAGNSFQDGNVGMITGQTALVSTIRKKNPNLQFGLAAVPKGPAPEPVGRAAYGGAGLLAIAKDSKYVPDAWTLTQWMVTPPALAMYVGKGLGFMSVAPKVNFYADDPVLTAAQDTLQYTVFWPYREWIFKFWDIESKGIGAFLTQKTSVDDGVKAMTALVNGMLQQQGTA